MHELSIAQSISEIAKSELRARPLSVLRRIGLRIGGLSGVHAESLQFCFEAIIKGTELEGCALVIEHLPILAECTECNRPFEVERFYFSCPQCGSAAVTVTQGYEQEIAYLEVDEESPAPGYSHNGVYHVDENPTGKESPV